MRVSELADVAGVTIRTIRHYHAIGLMPVPPRAGAWRDYGVDDASRLLRIRALADAGVALADMPRHLDGDAPVPDADGLDAAIAAIDARIAELEEHRHRLAALRGAAPGGAHSATALPVELGRLFDDAADAIAATGDEGALTLLRRKRLLTEIGVRLGFIDASAVAGLGDWDPGEVARYFSDFRRLTEPGWTEEGVRDLVARGMAMTPPPGSLSAGLLRAYRFFAAEGPGRALVLAAFPTPGQRRFIELSFDHFNSLIEESPDA